MVHLRYQFYHSFSARRKRNPLLHPFGLPPFMKVSDQEKSDIKTFRDMSSRGMVVVLHRPSVVTSGTTQIKSQQASESASCGYKRDDQSHSPQSAFQTRTYVSLVPFS